MTHGVIPGMCSVAFRDRSAAEVIRIARTAGLRVIEWGGDVHAPPGDLAVARDIATRTVDAGLAIASYGSYLRAGRTSRNEISALVNTAEALGAPRIRVWAGDLASALTDRDSYARAVADLQELGDACGERAVTVGLEYHADTLTDSHHSTLRLLDHVDRANVQTYWQPPVGMSDLEALRDLAAVLPRVCAVHAFSWWPMRERLALEARRGLWEAVVCALADRPAATDVLVEFVEGDRPEHLERDATFLNEISRQRLVG
jgi:3-dehydroshikimate dehydratase